MAIMEAATRKTTANVEAAFLLVAKFYKLGPVFSFLLSVVILIFIAARISGRFMIAEATIFVSTFSILSHISYSYEQIPSISHYALPKCYTPYHLQFS